MSRELVIETTPSGAHAGLLDDGVLIEVDVVDAGEKAPRGAIFLGRVKTIDPDLDAAFIDCGLDQDAYLNGRDARFLTRQPRGTPIGQQLREGDAIVVQIRREAEGGKAPRVTTDVMLAGPTVVYRPYHDDIELSGRLARSWEREAQRERATELFPEGGVLLRRAALVTDDAQLVADVERLRALWEAIETKAEQSTAPAVLHRLDDPLLRILAARASPDLERVVVADRTTLARARAILSEWQPALLDRLECVPRAFEATGAAEQLEEALQPEVPLPQGGSLVIEPTAALTAIDVNSGGRRALDVNLEAAGEIARQLRLRRIGGTIVVDFVDLPSRRDRARLFSALRPAFAEDPLPVQVFPMSPLGLVEISRRRTGRSLAEQLGRLCPSCGGAGLLPALSQQAERLASALAERGTQRVRVRVAPDLKAHLETAGAELWRDFAERQGSTPALDVDPTLRPGDFVIDEKTG